MSPLVTHPQVINHWHLFLHYLFLYCHIWLSVSFSCVAALFPCPLRSCGFCSILFIVLLIYMEICCIARVVVVLHSSSAHSSNFYIVVWLCVFLWLIIIYFVNILVGKNNTIKLLPC